MTESKPNYIFETESRRLKQYYSKHPEQLQNGRIIFNNSSGTVRYIGPLQHEGKPAGSGEELWVGLQWDDETRGKHNGTVNNFTYFVCPSTSGSLVKFQKIQFGYKLQTALFKRYFRAEELHQAKDIYESLKSFKNQMKEKNQQITEDKKKEVVTKKIHKIEYDSEASFATLKQSKKIMVQFVGFDQIWTKINNLQKLQSISLAQCRICDLGPRGHLSNILTNLRILSLEKNLISNWHQVFQLGMELKYLSQLSLTNNKIAPLNVNINDLKQISVQTYDQKYTFLQASQIFPSLKCLILINTDLTWKTLFSISSAFQKSLQELIICKNNLTDYENLTEENISRFESLTFLNLEDIKLQSFEPIKAFRKLPKLQKLILNRNKIQSLGKFQGFQNLKHLSVQFCEIISPFMLYEISLFKNLESLNIKHNPIGQRLGNSYVRMRAVAEIQKLNIINGAILKKYDRKDCEIFYMRQSFREYFALRKVPDYDYDYKDFLKFCAQNHPNVPKFIKKYGNPYEVQEKKEIKQIIKDQVEQNIIKKGTGMVQILIKNLQTDSIEPKKVPLSWTINNLRNYFAKVHKIPVSVQKLQVKVDQNSASEQVTEDHKNLGYYNVKSGSYLILSRKDAK